MEGQLIQYVNDNDPNSEVDYFPYTTFNAVFEDESKTLNLKQYIEEKILKSEQGGALGVEANTISGGAVGNKASADSGGAVGASAKTVTGGAVGKNAISEKGGAIGENAVTLLQLTKIGVLSGTTLPFNKKVTKGETISIEIKSVEGISSNAVNINITNAYTMTKNRVGDGYSPHDYFNIEMKTPVAYDNINADLYAREDFEPSSDNYERSKTVADATPIYVDIEYQIETNKEGGTGFAGGFNSKTTSGGAIGEKAETISGGAAGQGAESTWGGAIGQNASTQAGGAIGLRSYSEAGGAIGVDSKTTWGGAIGFLAESNWGFAGGEASLTKDGGSVGVGAKSNFGGAIGRSAKTENGGAIGQNASSLNGFAGGYEAKAEGANSIAIGSESIAQANAAVQLGTGKNETENTFKFIDHQISNGVSTQSSGSDMAEYFEWEDGNINKQDRRGYFVSLSNSKIRLANSNDDYILGVISSEYIASFVGNTAAENWKNKYLKDIYGDFILNENGEKIINPEFNDKTEYLPRFKRAEWAVVCLIGQIVINDDGTCVPGGYCKVNDNGEGTIANIEDNIKYKVLERLDNNHVRILFK